METRRSFLRRSAAGAAALGGGAAGIGTFGPVLDRALAYKPPAHATLSDIEHVVILMQENRSFDHYFGTLRGVRGFADPTAPSWNGRSVFNQLDPDIVANPQGYVLPFRLDDQTSSGQCVADQSHAWAAQQASWNNGHNDGFVQAHRVANGSGADTGSDCMGYYTRADIPFHYALADAFTLCDNYHCSVLGPTNPNRVMSMSGTIDAAGVRGGPVIDNSSANGQLKWTSYPERLEAAGISWFVYQESNNDTNNMLPLFAGVNSAPKTSPLSVRANFIIPTPKGAPFGPALAAQLRHDVVTGNLPQVSWILASDGNCEHPSAAPNAGAHFIAMVLKALTANPRSWAKTLLLITYDENDGFFDHVVPPTAPIGTADEYIGAAVAATHVAASDGFTGPVGLGFRVPMLLISPFTRGGMVASDVYDHTSILRLLETRFGVAEPNISAWRRSTVGDLSTAIGCLRTPRYGFPALPATAPLAAAAVNECDHFAAPAVPAHQAMPTQEPGTRPAVGAGCAAAPTKPKPKAKGTAKR